MKPQRITETEVIALELKRAASLLRRKIIAADRYHRRYARHKPARKGRGRTELTHTLFPYSKPFDIVQLAQGAWGITPAQPVRLNR